MKISLEASQDEGLPHKHMDCVLTRFSPNFVMLFIPGWSSYPHLEGPD